MGASAAGDIVAKGKFAEMMNVSPGRVSQWLSEGKISGDAIVGDGRMAKINVSVARQQLASSIDIGQSLGNGLSTNLVPADRGNPDDLEDSARARIELNKAQQAEITTRRMIEQDRLNRGRYVPAELVGTATAKAVAAILDTLDGSIAEVANALAAKLNAPKRDIAHELAQQFRQIRANAETVLRAQAEDMPATIEDTIEEPSEELVAAE